MTRVFYYLRKPVSRILSRMIIYLGRLLPAASTRATKLALAPERVYHAPASPQGERCSSEEHHLTFHL